MRKSVADRITLIDIIGALIRLLPQIPYKLLFMLKLVRISRRKYNSWGHFFEEQAGKYSSQIALKGGDEALTYAEVNACANQIARYLQSTGVTEGVVVPCMMKNSISVVLFFTALAKLGATASMIPTSMRGKALGNAVLETPFRLLIIDEEFTELFDNEISTAPSSIISVPHNWLHEPQSSFYKKIQRYSSEKLTETGAISSKSPVAYIFTSGTTGEGAKAAPITHRRMLRSALWFGRIVQSSTMKDTFYSPLPFYHSSSLVMGWPAAVVGGASYVMDEIFYIDLFWQKIMKWDVTVLIYVGEVLTYLINQNVRKPQEAGSLNRLLGNGLRIEIWEKVKIALGVTHIYEMYGATESSQVFSNILNLTSTIGMNFERYEIVRYNEMFNEVMRNEDGFALPVAIGEAGLFVYPVKEGQFQAYICKSDTAQKLLHNLFRPGDCWFNSGDLLQNLGYKHARFIDRTGDTYRWKGENCSTREVEGLIYEQFPQIGTVIVLGISLPTYDGRAGIVVIEQGNEELLEDMGGLFRRELIPAVIPRFIRFTTVLQRTESFKILKKALQNEGISPENSSDTFYLWDIHQQSYVSLNAVLCKQIAAGTLHL